MDPVAVGVIFRVPVDLFESREIQSCHVAPPASVTYQDVGDPGPRGVVDCTAPPANATCRTLKLNRPSSVWSTFNTNEYSPGRSNWSPNSGTAIGMTPGSPYFIIGDGAPRN